MIEKLDTFGCTIITDEGQSVNVLNDKVALKMFETINLLVEEVNHLSKYISEQHIKLNDSK